MRLNGAKKIIEQRWIVFLICSVTFLSCITFWKVLSFGFWRDDWGFIWAAMYQPDTHLAWNLHPGTKYEDILLVRLFGLNATLWQGFGIFLRIIASLSIALMMWGFSQSKKIAILVGLFFSVTFADLESVSWRSVHVVAVDIIFISIGFYFLSKYLTFKKVSYYIGTLIFFVFAVLSDPQRSIPIILLSALFYFLSYHKIGKKLKQTTLELGVTSFILLSTMYLASLTDVAEKQYVVRLIKQDVFNPDKYLNFFASIGNLVLGWIINVPESGGLSNFIGFNAYFGMIFLFISSSVCIYLIIKKKSQYAKLSLFFIFWIILFYLPNWSFDKNLVIGGTHRYIGIASVGLIALVSLLIGKIKNLKLVLLFSGIFIVLNIHTSQRILNSESVYRLKSIEEKMWNQINLDVPKDEKNSIFIYMGSDITKGNLLDWSGPMPFGIMRGMKEEYEFPVSNVDYQVITDLVCKENVKRPFVSGWGIQKTKIPFSHIHAWEVNNGIMRNVSAREKGVIQKMAEVQKCEVNP